VFFRVKKKGLTPEKKKDYGAGYQGAKDTTLAGRGKGGKVRVVKRGEDRQNVSQLTKEKEIQQNAYKHRKVGTER